MNEWVKLSLDGKMMANCICDGGEENLSGFERSPMFEERKEWLKEERSNVQLVMDTLKDS